MSMTFQALDKNDGRVFTDEEEKTDDSLTLNFSAGNDAYILEALGFKITFGNFEEKIDVFIERCYAWYDFNTREKNKQDVYLVYGITRLWQYAVRAKARGGYVIMGA